MKELMLIMVVGILICSIIFFSGCTSSPVSFDIRGKIISIDNYVGGRSWITFDNERDIEVRTKDVERFNLKVNDSVVLNIGTNTFPYTIQSVCHSLEENKK